MQKKKFVKISEHFSNKDFICKCQNNEEFKLSLGLIGGLELLRSLARKRINIVKGFVCSDCHEKQKKVKKNYHTMGLAADITIDGLSVQEAFKFAEEIPEFKGLGLNLTDKYVHVDTRKNNDRTTWVTSLGQDAELTLENRTQYLGE